MEARNVAAHKGTLTLSQDDLEVILRGFNDLLWLFDFYAGHGWAMEFISVETQRDLAAQSGASSPG